MKAKNAYFGNSNLDQVNARHGVFEYSSLENCSIKDADLKMADFRFSYLTNVDFSGSDMRDANFKRAQMDGAKFNNAIMYYFQKDQLLMSGVTKEQLTLVRWKENPINSFQPPIIGPVLISKKRNVFVGPKGGKYYFNDNGRKVYLSGK